MAERQGRAPSLHLARAAAGVRQGRAERVLRLVASRGRRVAQDGHQGIGGSGVVGEAGLSDDRPGVRGLRGPALQRSPPGRQERVAGRQHARGRSAGRVADLHAEDCTRRLHHRPPPRTPAQVGQQGGLHGGLVGCRRALSECGQAHEDARRAEAALAGARRLERRRPPFPQAPGEPLHRGDRAVCGPARRGDAGGPCGAVDPDRAAPALALRTAAVLRAVAAQLLAQHLEEGGVVVDVRALDPVEPERARWRRRSGSHLSGRAGRDRRPGCGPPGRASGPGRVGLS